MTDTQQPSAAEISRAELAAREPGSVTVEIYDQVYQLRGVEEAHIEQLASFVDSKMRSVSAHGATVDSLRVAVLAALNIADELATLRARYDALSASLAATATATTAAPAQTSFRTRAGSLMGMLDEVLEERLAS